MIVKARVFEMRGIVIFNTLQGDGDPAHDHQILGVTVVVDGEHKAEIGMNPPPDKED